MVHRQLFAMDDRLVGSEHVERHQFFFATNEEPWFVATDATEQRRAKHARACPMAGQRGARQPVAAEGLARMTAQVGSVSSSSPTTTRGQHPHIRPRIEQSHRAIERARIPPGAVVAEGDVVGSDPGGGAIAARSPEIILAFANAYGRKQRFVEGCGTVVRCVVGQKWANFRKSEQRFERDKQYRSQRCREGASNARVNRGWLARQDQMRVTGSDRR